MSTSKRVILALSVLMFLPACLPLALNSAQNDRAAAMQKQSDDRYMEIERRLATLEAQRDGGK